MRKMERYSIGYENFQPIYRWKALAKENMLGKSIFKIVLHVTLAPHNRDLDCKNRMDDLERDKANWWSREFWVGPTMHPKMLI